MYDGENLHTSFRDGEYSNHAFLDDYAFYVTALVELYNSTLGKAYLKKAEKFCKETIKQFMDHEDGGFYFFNPKNTELFINPKEIYDGVIISGNSVMAYNLVRLYGIREKEEYRELFEKQMKFMSIRTYEYPSGNSFFIKRLNLFRAESCQEDASISEKSLCTDSGLLNFNNWIILESWR